MQKEKNKIGTQRPHFMGKHDAVVACLLPKCHVLLLYYSILYYCKCLQRIGICCLWHSTSRRAKCIVIWALPKSGIGTFVRFLSHLKLNGSIYVGPEHQTLCNQYFMQLPFKKWHCHICHICRVSLSFTI